MILVPPVIFTCISSSSCRSKSLFKTLSISANESSFTMETFVFDGFNSAAFMRFGKYYVDGFAATFAGACHQDLSFVYFPSSVFLDELPFNMIEYIAAKAAGEALCLSLAKAFPAISFACPRLPRIATDQSLSLVPSTKQALLPLVLAQVEQYIQRTL